VVEMESGREMEFRSEEISALSELGGKQ
jgi:hypothetical protein